MTILRTTEDALDVDLQSLVGIYPRARPAGEIFIDRKAEPFSDFPLRGCVALDAEFGTKANFLAQPVNDNKT